MAAVPAARPSGVTGPDTRRACAPTFHRVVRRAVARGITAGLGAAVAAGVLVGVSTTSTTTAPEPTTARDLAPVAAAPASADFRAFTLNVAFPLGVEKATADMRRAMSGLGAVAGGFQEMSGREDRDAMVALTQELDWGYYMPKDGGITIPVVWDRDRFRLIDERTVKVHGAIDARTPSRWINTVRLRELATGKVFGVINTHTIAQASRDAQASDPERIPYLRKHLAMLRAEILALSASTEHVVAMGDLNVNYLADRRRQVAGLPTRAFGDIVNFDMPLTGSRGTTSLLDYILTLKHGGGFARTGAQVVRGFNSDHDAVVATYDVVDLFATGPVTNAPFGGVHGQRAVLDRWSRAVRDTEPGAAIAIATPRLDDPTVVADLLAAHDRGVGVRLLLAGGARTAGEQQLLTALGEDPVATSWVRPAGAPSRASYLLADRTGGTTALTISSVTPADATATSALADAWMTSHDGVHAAFLRTFEQLATGPVPAGPGAGVAVGGGYRMISHPVIAGDDPVLQALRPITCTGATGPRNARGRTQLRISTNGWGGSRGREIAELVAARAKRGCDVRVLAGRYTGKAVVTTLRRAGVQVKQVATAQHLLLVDGRYGRSRNQQLTWTGPATWGNVGLTQVAPTVRVPGAATLLAYRKQFDDRWARG